jgi:hypothetical protein
VLLQLVRIVRIFNLVNKPILPRDFYSSLIIRLSKTGDLPSARLAHRSAMARDLQISSGAYAALAELSARSLHAHASVQRVLSRANTLASAVSWVPISMMMDDSAAASADATPAANALLQFSERDFLAKRTSGKKSPPSADKPAPSRAVDSATPLKPQLTAVALPWQALPARPAADAHPVFPLLEACLAHDLAAAKTVGTQLDSLHSKLKAVDASSLTNAQAALLERATALAAAAQAMVVTHSDAIGRGSALLAELRSQDAEFPAGAPNEWQWWAQQGGLDAAASLDMLNLGDFARSVLSKTRRARAAHAWLSVYPPFGAVAAAPSTGASPVSQAERELTSAVLEPFGRLQQFVETIRAAVAVNSASDASKSHGAAQFALDELPSSVLRRLHLPTDMELAADGKDDVLRLAAEVILPSLGTAASAAAAASDSLAANGPADASLGLLKLLADLRSIMVQLQAVPQLATAEAPHGKQLQRLTHWSKASHVPGNAQRIEALERFLSEEQPVAQVVREERLRLLEANKLLVASSDYAEAKQLLLRPPPAGGAADGRALSVEDGMAPKRAGAVELLTLEGSALLEWLKAGNLVDMCNPLVQARWPANFGTLYPSGPERIAAVARAVGAQMASQVFASGAVVRDGLASARELLQSMATGVLAAPTESVLENVLELLAVTAWRAQRAGDAHTASAAYETTVRALREFNYAGVSASVKAVGHAVAAAASAGKHAEVLGLFQLALKEDGGAGEAAAGKRGVSLAEHVKRERAGGLSLLHDLGGLAGSGAEDTGASGGVQALAEVVAAERGAASVSSVRLQSTTAEVVDATVALVRKQLGERILGSVESVFVGALLSAVDCGHRAGFVMAYKAAQSCDVAPLLSSVFWTVALWGSGRLFGAFRVLLTYAEALERGVPLGEHEKLVVLHELALAGEGGGAVHVMRDVLASGTVWWQHVTSALEAMSGVGAAAASDAGSVGREWSDGAQQLPAALRLAQPAAEFASIWSVARMSPARAAGAATDGGVGAARERAMVATMSASGKNAVHQAALADHGIDLVMELLRVAPSEYCGSVMTGLARLLVHCEQAERLVEVMRTVRKMGIVRLVDGVRAASKEESGSGRPGWMGTRMVIQERTESSVRPGQVSSECETLVVEHFLQGEHVGAAVDFYEELLEGRADRGCNERLLGLVLSHPLVKQSAQERLTRLLGAKRVTQLASRAVVA